MPVRIRALATLGVTALVSAGCISMPFGGGDSRREAAPAPVAAAPAGALTAAALPPPPGGPAAATTPPPSGLAALDPGMQGTAAAAPAPAATDVEVGRTDLLGGWTLASGGDSCQLFMTLTTWSGGYRASTKGCSNAALQKISAWNMEGKQVQLLNDSGATVARLYPASKTQFNGQTEGGGPVSVSR
jgi:hypothetical protein